MIIVRQELSSACYIIAEAKLYPPLCQNACMSSVNIFLSVKLFPEEPSQESTSGLVKSFNISVRADEMNSARRIKMEHQCCVHQFPANLNPLFMFMRSR
jgi:hypothetical protein